MKLYCIGEHESGPIKIGISMNPKQRLGELQSGNPRKLKIFNIFDLTGHSLLSTGNTAHSIESALHRELQQYRLMREWFDISAQRANRHISSFFRFKQIKFIDLGEFVP